MVTATIRNESDADWGTPTNDCFSYASVSFAEKIVGDKKYLLYGVRPRRDGSWSSDGACTGLGGEAQDCHSWCNDWAATYGIYASNGCGRWISGGNSVCSLECDGVTTQIGAAKYQMWECN